jgi:hypothetical protein
MCQDVRPKLGLSIEVMQEYMDRLEMQWILASDIMMEQDLIGAAGAYLDMSSYAALLRENKGFLLDLFGLRQHPQGKV